MYPRGLPQFLTLLALRDWTSFALDLDKWPVGVVTRRGSVTPDERFASERDFVGGVCSWMDNTSTMQTLVVDCR